MSAPQSSFSLRLERARKMRAFSLRELSAQMDGLVSSNALAKYENGLMRPGSDVLIALCRALKLSPDYFFKPVAVALSGIEFRKRTSFTKKDEQRVREEALDFFERYLEVEGVLGVEQTLLPRADLRAVAPEALDAEAEAAARMIRDRWDMGANAIPNIHEMLEDHGVKVKEVESDKTFDGFSGWADQCPVIVLASWLGEDLPRKRFTAAHELGHLVMQLPEGLDKKREEALCHRFAGALLVPAEILKRELGEHRDKISLKELLAFKAEWGISIGALMRRLGDLGIITQARLKNFQFQYRAKFQWHKGEPGEWIGSESSLRFSQMVYRAAAQELVTQSKAAQWLDLNLTEFNESLALVG